jgi:hypothetical protein
MRVLSGENNTIDVTWKGKMSANLSSEGDPTPVDAILNTLEMAERRSNWMILVGAPDWVKGVIQRLHSAQIVEVSSWSKLLSTRKSDEVISVLQRPRGAEKVQR